MYLYKAGYVSLEYDILPGSTVTKNIKLSPLDSHITFKISNKLGKTNYIFGSYWSSALYYQFMSAFKDPIPVPMGTVYKETRLIPGNTNIYISWDYSSYPSDKYFPHLDSIYVLRGDTVTYNITM